MKNKNKILNEDNIKLKYENLLKQYNNGKYEGEFKNNKKEGKGIFYYSNSNIYKGD